MSQTEDNLQAALALADREGWSPEQRLQLLALFNSDRPIGKPAWRSFTFWLAGLAAAASLAVGIAGAFSGNKTAATVGTIAGAVVAATAVLKNSKDKQTDAHAAARKLEAVMAGAVPPPAGPALVPPPGTPAANECSTCNGTGVLPVPDPTTGHVTGRRPCPDCRGTGRA